MLTILHKGIRECQSGVLKITQKLVTGLLVATTFIGFSFAQETGKKQAQLDPSELLYELVAGKQAHLSIGEAKLHVDLVIDPSSDVAAVREAVNRLAGETFALAGTGADDNSKMVAMRTILYEPGPWNDHRPFAYDHDDPQGQNVNHKTMAYYISSRKGNCVTMPMLILMIGELLDLDMTFTTAPQHLFVHFDPKEQSGDSDLQRIEGTSGGYPQTLSWMRKQFPSITDQALENDIYFARLDETQSKALVGETLMQYLFEKEDHREQAQVAELILSFYPNNDNAILHRAGAYDRVIRKEIVSKYPSMEDMPADVFTTFQTLAEIVYTEEQRLLSLGWRPNNRPDQ